MEIIKCPACRNEITGDDVFKGKQYIRCPACGRAVFRLCIEKPYTNKQDIIVELMDGSKINLKDTEESPYDIIGNYVEEKALQKTHAYDDIFVLMSFHENPTMHDCFHARLEYEPEEGGYVWEYDWWEGKPYVRLVNYASEKEIAEWLFCMKPDKVMSDGN